MTVPEDQPQTSGDTGGNAIQSEILLTLVQSRAHILSVMSNPRLSLLAKNVGCVLWAVTETWGPGEERAVTMPQIAEAITYTMERADGPVEVHPFPRRVAEVLKVLEAEGYVALRSPQWGAAGVGRGSTTGIRMNRRTVADPYTHGEKVFRSWTQNILEQNPEIVDAVKRKVHRSAAPSKKGDRSATPSGKVQRSATPSAIKGGVALHLLKKRVTVALHLQTRKV